MSFLPLKFWRSRGGVTIAAAFVVLALFFVRPGVQKLHDRIVSVISLAMGRPVEISSVSFRLLPRPAFDLENFVVHENPAFGAEPMLRSSQVTAALRLTSLVRGRLEISRLSLSEASMNLVRNEQGRWNLEELLERNDQIPAAPTSKAKYERRPAFPYIEASGGRINCKLGQEKTPYSLTDADFTLWQDSENSWGMRLKATPLRTNDNVNDTGLLTVEGKWLRARSLHETPLQFQLQWDRAQLGQVTKLIRGADAGWRGALRINAALSGTPGELKIASTVMIQDFRRFDVLTNSALRLAASCDGTYTSENHSIPEFTCNAPVGLGTLSVNGNVEDLLGARNCDLKLTAKDLSLQSVVALALHANKKLPPDLLAAGTGDASFTFRRAPETAGGWQGDGTTNDFRLTSTSASTDMVLGSVPFFFEPDGKKHDSHSKNLMVLAKESRLYIGPFRTALGHPTVVQGWVSRSGYGFQVQGEGQQQLLATARSLGMTIPRLSPVGAKARNLQFAGNWAGIQAQSVMKD